MLGMVLTSLAMAMSLAYAYRYVDFPEAATNVVRVATLQFIPRSIRLGLVLAAGLASIGFGFWRLSHSLTAPLLARSDANRPLAHMIAEHRFGPDRAALNVVALGGGTGLSTLLRGLKHCDASITAIVTVSDDGGSTGRIRSEFNIPAPGDIRNCIVALADAESTVGRLFQYRFDQPGSALEGHAFGNLFITALTQITGSFEQAVIEASQVLAVRGRVLPSTLENVTLAAELIDGTIVRGESTISRKQAPIKRIFLEPRHPIGYEPALSAILNADLIVLGPGSLYTSVLPNLLVDGIVQAVRWSAGTVVYVCNVATQPGETDHFGASDHIHEVVQALGSGVLACTLVNSNTAPSIAIKPEWRVDAVTFDSPRPGSQKPDVPVVTRDVVDDSNPLRHDPDKLAAALLEIARERVPRLPIDDSLGSTAATDSWTAPVANDRMVAATHMED